MAPRTTTGKHKAWEDLSQGLKTNKLSIQEVTSLVDEAKDLVVNKSDKGFTLLH